jgi:hypothetical protein
MSNLTQITYLPLRKGIKPEDPQNSQEGGELYKVFKETTYQHGYVTSAWGRTLEDENLVIWVIGVLLGLFALISPFSYSLG